MNKSHTPSLHCVLASATIPDQDDVTSCPRRDSPAFGLLFLRLPQNPINRLFLFVSCPPSLTHSFSLLGFFPHIPPH